MSQKDYWGKMHKHLKIAFDITQTNADPKESHLILKQTFLPVE